MLELVKLIRTPFVEQALTMPPVRICAIASEVTPLSKTGGLADVAGALTKHLHAHGHDVRLFTPLYDGIDTSRFEILDSTLPAPLAVQLGEHRFEYAIRTVKLPGSEAHVYLVDCPVLYGRGVIYSTEPDEYLRFLALTRIAIECCQHMAWSPQILHCHDWHAGFGPLLLRELYGWDRLLAATRSVITIHNIGYQGIFGAEHVGDLDLGGRAFLLHQDDLRGGHINPLKHGCMYADAITTVSPTYAREIRTPKLGMGLETVLNQRADALSGILNGVDYDEWDPRTDRYLGEHYDASTLQVKTRLKWKLLARLGLNVTPQTVLAGVVSRLAVQKGIELIVEALPKLLKTQDLAFVALGSGEPRYEAALQELQQQFPERVFFQKGYDESFAHWIEAGSDLFLMPSQYEPCGLNQMYSLRYGTVPVVRRTGGLADSVHRYDPGTGRGTGMLFDAFTPEALGNAIRTVLALHAVPSHWNRLVRNGMAEDFSWERQGAQYVALYRRLIGG